MEPAAKAGDKKKKMIIGGVVASLLIVSVIIIAVTTTDRGGQMKDGDSVDVDGGSDVDDDRCYNPMCSLFNTQPMFKDYTYMDT